MRAIIDIIRTPQDRNVIDTAEKCQGLIDALEDTCPHEDLPAHYDWLISKRDALEKSESQP
jgi:hypothetical protein